MMVFHCTAGQMRGYQPPKQGRQHGQISSIIHSCVQNVPHGLPGCKPVFRAITQEVLGYMRIVRLRGVFSASKNVVCARSLKLLPESKVSMVFCHDGPLADVIEIEQGSSTCIVNIC